MVKAGEKLKESKKKSKMPSANPGSKRDWGKVRSRQGRAIVFVFSLKCIPRRNVVHLLSPKSDGLSGGIAPRLERVAFTESKTNRTKRIVCCHFLTGYGVRRAAEDVQHGETEPLRSDSRRRGRVLVEVPSRGENSVMC